MSETHRSKLAEAIEARERKTHPFDVADFFGLGDKPLLRLGIRVNTKSEQDAAIVAAYKRIENETKNGAELARDDSDLTTDAKTIEVLFRACRDPEDPKYPAFPGPMWMRDNLTTDQLAIILNLYNEVVRYDSPIDFGLDDDRIEAIAAMASKNADTLVADQILASYDREFLIQVVILLSVKLQLARSGADLESANEAVDADG